ncbi:hypothetical protein B0H10DRAFT_2017709 [Mycena sp. CBHHK59/15]|nr:hypothetical protein B0H10DRAFT_2017709 [Mycena sp. CBHHK59/15]
MSTNVFSLPVPLILLVHLHILQYPHANKPEYDHNIFDSHFRGLRDRTRTMEDICYFLVGRIEGTKDLARKILPTYPCSQPADNTAFRTSLAKFLEALRHATRPGKTMSPPASGTKSLAWWWKDVVVRKSLLEECSGERFERILLALSTHALLKGSTTHVGPDETNPLLRRQPRIYMTRLTAFQSSRNSWARQASLLLQQQSDLKILRAHVLRHGPTKYASLSTQKLLALADSKLQDLLATQWTGSTGRSALGFLIELSGLQRHEMATPTVTSPVPAQEANEPVAPVTPPPPLPIAAAHHPATLRKLSKRLFPKSTSDVTSDVSTPAPAHATVALSGRIDAEGRMLQALTNALTRTRKVAKELAGRLNIVPKQKEAKQPLRSLDLNLWQDTHPSSVDFETHPTDTSLTAMGLSPPGSEPTLESRIHDIRHALRPQYPPVPRGQEQASTSRLPQRTTRAPAAPQTPKAPRRLVTSTPPETVKSRSRQRPVASLAGSRPSLLGVSTSDSDSELCAENVCLLLSSLSAVLTTVRPQATPRAQPRRGPSAAFPSLVASPSYRDLLQSDSEDEDEFRPLDSKDVRAFRPLAQQRGLDDDDDDYLTDAPSMSVRDLLLQADTTHFDLIGIDDDEDDQSFDWA